MFLSKGIEWLSGYMNQIHMYANYIRDSLQIQRDTHKLKMREKDIPYKWKSKESCGSNAYIRQNRL